MLRQTRLLLLASFGIGTLAAFGCTVKSVDTNNPVQTTSNGAGGTTSVSSSAVGTGGTSVSTTAGTGGSNTVSSTSGTGGGTCAGQTGKGSPVAADCSDPNK